MNPEKEYKERKKSYGEQLEKLKERNNRISNIRLLVLIAGIALSLWFYEQKDFLFVTISLLVTLVVFIVFVVVHHQVSIKKNQIQALYNMNVEGIQHMEGQWHDLGHSGECYVDEHHAFSWDLDLFGRGSLFHWMNHTGTPIGEKKLQDALIRPRKTPEAIKERQEAVKELATKIGWMQAFRSASLQERKKPIQDEHSLLDWGKKIDSRYLRPWLKWVVRLLPIGTIITIVLGLTSPDFPRYIPLLAFVIQAIASILFLFGKNNSLQVVGEYRKQIRVYEKMIHVLETEKFHSPLLRRLQGQLIYKGKETASKQIKKLDRIMDMVSLRYIQFYLFFDILTLWDYHCIIALEGWKAKYGKMLSHWLNVLGEVEALVSIGTIVYEEPTWTMPTILDQHVIGGKSIGHPLIQRKDRVTNHFEFGRDARALLITGSNMSGKSTFLRTIGINMVLAYAGAPVCAEAFSCPVMDIYTSMRVKDDIDNKVSSFYAELLRIKQVIKAANEGKHVFYLLDEIFKGTNSRDRHIGAKTLIKRLAKEQTLGLVSTHDLELAELADEAGSKIGNYHFQEYYKGDKICFDYTLYEGVSTTFNAVYLMRQIGINIE